MKSFLKWLFLLLLISIILLVSYFIYLNKQSDIITQGEPIPQYDTLRSALLVIDIQEVTTGKVSITEEYVQQSDSLIKRTNEVIQFSQDNNIPVVYIYTQTDNWFIHLINSTMKKGTVGTQIDARVHLGSEYIFPKEKKDSFSNPELDNFMSQHQISRLYFVGLDAAHCVRNTISAGLNRGYEIFVIEDALISETEDLKKEMIEYYNKNGVKIINSSDYAGSLKIKNKQICFRIKYVKREKDRSNFISFMFFYIKIKCGRKFISYLFSERGFFIRIKW
jgi:nicotinamidase-related amidase